MKPPLIILAGPTASGKTELSLKLARAVGGSIVSADSIQVYRHMDIGSAKIKPEEMQGIPHYLIDVLHPNEEFNVMLFQKLAKQAMDEIYAQGRIPILVGGTGFYIQAVLYAVDFSKESGSSAIRSELQAYAKENGNAALHKRLEAVDAASADAIHPNNQKRVIRALEFYLQNGYPISRHNAAERQKEPFYQSAYFVLNDRRERIYAQIERRVEEMLQNGLLEEVKRLKEMGCHKGMASMQGLGYKELLSYLDGELTYEEAVRRIKLDTRHFAKRQLTWFGREKDVIWLQKEAFSYDTDRMLFAMLATLREKEILL